MRKLIFILAILILSSCAILKVNQAEYCVIAKNEFGTEFRMTVPTLEQNIDNDDFKKLRYFYDGKWILGETWFNSLNYPYRSKKEQEKFEKKYYKQPPTSPRVR